jgi:sterol desaturase/sphingolipid hydroxylase (fatty acid hydroxylase superfamily)
METLLLSALAMTLIVALRYLATSGFFAWLTGIVRPGLYAGMRQQIGREIRWSLLAAALYGVPAGVVAWGWDRHGWTVIYRHWSDYPLWYAPLSVLLYMAAHDAWFYWTHRYMHGPRSMRLGHAVHHASRPPTAWAAMSFSVAESLSGALVIPLLVLLIPIHVSMLGVVLAIMTLMGITNHMGWEMFPKALVNGPLGRWLITASHHQKHHEAYRGNYGLYFRFWDRLCGTDLGLGSFAASGEQRTGRPAGRTGA